MQQNPKKVTRELSVRAIQDITRHYRRITLTGEELTGFPADETGGYIKLMFHDARYNKPLMRTYTIRDTRIEKLEIDVDFVLHQDSGPASLWAQQAEIGSTIEVGGPGPKKPVDPNSDWFLFAGDMTALPAICVNLALLPEDANGVVVVEVISEDDIQSLTKPENIQVKWVLNPRSGIDPSILVNAVKAVPWQSGTPSIWTACEFKAMKELRNYYKNEKGIDRKAFYISSYWKHGVSEDEHKLIKKQDSDLFLST